MCVGRGIGGPVVPRPGCLLIAPVFFDTVDPADDHQKMAAQYRAVIAAAGEQPEAAWLKDQRKRHGLNQPSEADVERAELEQKVRLAFANLFDGDEPDWISAGKGQARLGRGRLQFTYSADQQVLVLKKLDRDDNPFGEVAPESPEQALAASEDELRSRGLL
jgi:hypothetical protein